MKNSTIYLIGLRGSGKTTVGKQLANDLDLGFTDLDAFLAKKVGHTVADIVQSAGWQEFRRIESLCLAEAARPLHVIATGGGIILSPENREFLKRTGFVVWLNPPLPEIAKRLSAQPEFEQRPPLTQLDPASELKQIMQEREHFYRDCCECAIDSPRDPAAISAVIQRLLADQ